MIKGKIKRFIEGLPRKKITHKLNRVKNKYSRNGSGNLAKETENIYVSA
jgi:hypothetical protein